MKIQLQYFSFFGDLCGKNSETLNTNAKTAKDLYREIEKLYKFEKDPKNFRVAINDEFVDWDQVLQENDNVVFIPPVAGG